MKPILFNGPMVRAILDGRKTQTRRIIKAGPHTIVGSNVYIDHDDKARPSVVTERGGHILSPYQVGDILYVRETWCNVNKPGHEPEYYYFADTLDSGCEDYIASEWKWRPSIHMPKKAARIFLRVTNVKANRLTEMTEKDAKAEGARVATNMSGIMYRLDFIKIWESTLKPSDFDRYKWDANPWVWVIEFEVAEVKDNE